jgi:hypothetical protein
MTYSKEVIGHIVADYAKGADVEETRNHIKSITGKNIGQATIYRHRADVTVEQIVDELQRQQERDITKEPNSDIRMYYRDKLLEKLMPLKQIIISKNINQSESVVKHVIQLVDPDNPAPTYPQTEVQAARRAGVISS